MKNQIWGFWIKITACFVPIGLLFFCFWSCSSEIPKEKQVLNIERFAEELAQLQSFFTIPGMAAIVEKNGKIVFEQYSGFADLETQTKVDASTVFPLASLTKTYSAVLVMKLVEQGKLSLDSPMNRYLDSSSLSDSIQVRHVLSHTSQGNIGEEFFYSHRFGLLTQVLENASGKTFQQLMQEEIFQPLKLNSTFLLKDSAGLAIKSLPFASPYFLEEGAQKGFIDFGYSTSAGVASTAQELLAFSQALDQDFLIPETAKNQLFSSFQPGLPYGFGIFHQQVEGLDVVWGYGQYDCYSSLLLKVPAQNLTLILLANNNLMSDPARLIMGDVTTSLFVLSFLKNTLLDQSEMTLMEKSDSLYKEPYAGNEFYRKKVLAQALATSFMARFDPENHSKSARMVSATFRQHPDYLAYADINLLHTLCFLKDAAFYLDLGEFNQFDQEIEQIGKHLLKASPNDPYLHTYMANFYDRKGDVPQAKYHFEQIVNLFNFSPNWYTKEAQAWLQKQ